MVRDAPASPLAPPRRFRWHTAGLMLCLTALSITAGSGCFDANTSCDGCDWSREYCSVERGACGQDGLGCGAKVYAFCVPYPDECGNTPSCGCLHPILMSECAGPNPPCEGDAASGFTLRTEC